MPPDGVLRQLSAAVRGRVFTDPVPDRFHVNYGGYARGRPDIVVETTCEEDVRAVLLISRRFGLPLTVRGTGHSSNPRSGIANGGILLVNVPASEPDLSFDRGLADVEARAHWEHVERRLNDAGTTTRVLPDTLTLSVGGTASAGGYGARSIRWGGQVDNIESIRLILPDATLIECSRVENAEWLRLALGGGGALGVIERVRFHTAGVPVATRAYLSVTATWRRLLEALGEISTLDGGGSLADLPMELSASCHTDGRGFLRRRYYFPTHHDAVASEPSWLPPLAVQEVQPVQRSSCFADAAGVDEWLRRFRGTAKVWADYVLDYSQFLEFMAQVERRVRGGHPGHRYLPSVYLLMIRVSSSESASQGFAAASAFSPMAGATGAFRFGCGLYHMVPANDAAGVTAAVDGCEYLVRRCIELGGRPYLHGVMSMSEATKQQVYGADYDRLLRLRRQYDPDQLFNSNALCPDPTI